MSNPLVADLLIVARELVSKSAEQSDDGTLHQAFLRKSISAAYYALFHTLCYVVAARLGEWSRIDELEPIYRSVDHGVARKVLNSPIAAALHVDLPAVGAAFTDLQRIRHEADYSPPGRRFGTNQPFTVVEATAWIDEARAAVALIEGLSETIQRQLAIHLIARPRRS